MITSQIDGLKLKGDILPRDWKQSGLLHPSIIRLTKIATLDSELIEKKLGTLSAGDSKEFAKSLREHFSHWLK
jgi:mRNA interferase MazF